MASVMRTDLGDYLPLVASGKIREIYSLEESKLLFVATDRISGMTNTRGYWCSIDNPIAFDVVMKNVRVSELLAQSPVLWGYVRLIHGVRLRPLAKKGLF